MESQSALVRSDGTVVLDSISAVDLDLVVVVFPFDSELDDPFGLDDSVENLVLQIKGIGVDHIDNGCDDFPGCLDELRLCGILSFKFGHELVKFVHFFLRMLLSLSARTVYNQIGGCQLITYK